MKNLDIKLSPHTEQPWKKRVLPQDLEGGVYISGGQYSDWKGLPLPAYSNVEDGFLVTSRIVTWEGVTVRTELGLKRAINKLLKLEAEA